MHAGRGYSQQCHTLQATVLTQSRNSSSLMVFSSMHSTTCNAFALHSLFFFSVASRASLLQYKFTTLRTKPQLMQMSIHSIARTSASRLLNASRSTSKKNCAVISNASSYVLASNISANLNSVICGEIHVKVVLPLWETLTLGHITSFHWRVLAISKSPYSFGASGLPFSYFLLRLVICSLTLLG